jgi:hypothetical protein
MASYILNPTTLLSNSPSLATNAPTVVEALNGGPSSPDDTSYIYNTYFLTSVDAIFYFNTPSATGTISEVKLYLRCRINTSGSNTFNVGVIIGGTKYMKTVTNVGTPGYYNFNQSFALNPATGLAWTWSDFSSIKFVLYLWTSVGASNIFSSAFWAEIVYADTTTYFLRKLVKVKQIP